MTPKIQILGDKVQLFLKRIDILSLNSQDEFFKTLKQLFEKMIDEELFVFPVMPTIASELMFMIEDQDASFSRVANVVKKDQIVAARLLNLANSPYYMSLHAVGNIEEAVRRIGVEEVKRLTFLVAMSTYMVKKGRYSNYIKKFWQHSVATAITAEQISLFVKVEPSFNYIAALLHDVGKVLVLLTILELERIVGDKDLFDDAVIIRLCKEFHVQLGKLLAKKWELPESVQKSISQHHRLIDAMDLVQSSLLVIAADNMVKELGFEDAASEPLGELRIYPLLGMDENDVAQTKNKATLLCDHFFNEVLAE